MNKNAIQKYAIWARNELIEQVKQRAYQYGISDKGYGDENAAIIAGRVLSADEKRQRREFVTQIKVNGFEQAVEEVAYTWFNRFIALRFMEVNDYLPTHVRVFSDVSGGFNPEILKDVLHIDLPGLDKAKVSDLLNYNKTEELYRYLLLTQCNALNEALPEMFKRLGSYTEMLLPNNILKPDSVLGRLVTDIPEEDFLDAVQIIGWMYQYYNTEPKQAVFDGLKKNFKITKEKIPAATQLFTPDWIVRYMVENSLGRLWLESHPNNTLKANWKYYLDEAEQTPEVTEKLRVLRSQSPVKSPEDIRLIDPFMGSGHILVYMFDVLMQIYESNGYNTREAAASIVENNLYGLDIDDRAAQLAYFAVMMKARQYDRRFFSRGIQPHVYSIKGSNHIDRYAVKYFCDGDIELEVAIGTIIRELHDVNEYGSIVNVSQQDWSTLYKRFDEIINDINIAREIVMEELLPLVQIAEAMAQKYDVIVTNPPYMSSGGMGEKLLDFVKENYPDVKSDLSTVCMERTMKMCKTNGYIAMINIPVWMFIQAYKKLREDIVRTRYIVNMVHLGRGVFGSDFGTTAFVISNRFIKGCSGNYLRLFDKQNAVDSLEQKEQWFFARKGFYKACQDSYLAISSVPIAYWLSTSLLNAFKSFKSLKYYAIPASGTSTGDNDKFLRLWPEVDVSKIGLNLPEDYDGLTMKWIPCNKGGAYRKWYGNYDYVMDWENNGFGIRNNRDEKGKLKSRPLNLDKNFLPGLTWTKVGAGAFSLRYFPSGFICESIGAALYQGEADLLSILGLLNTKIADAIMAVINPTMGCQPGDLAVIPTYIPKKIESNVHDIVKECIELSKNDWDFFETSWNFKRHPFVEMASPQRWNGALYSSVNISLRNVFKEWKSYCNERFNKLKTNEEELNRIFLDIYSLQDELTPEVEDKDITVNKANLTRDIKSFFSYAVGCMFGRYSLDTEGLAYAGGDWDNTKYRTFIPDKDNILPICDDEYFDDDIMGRFVDFVRVVYGVETLEENLKFIADALDGKGTPREVIRNYFLNDFFTDHCKIYQKRPIYWMFDSGKKNGFKALIYLHRYSRDLLAKLRTDYVHEQQERYRTQLSHIAAALNTATGSERARLLKQQDKLTEQLKEITVFEEKVHHLADQNIEIDLDDGVKKNYEIFTDVLTKL